MKANKVNLLAKAGTDPGEKRGKPWPQHSRGRLCHTILASAGQATASALLATMLFVFPAYGQNTVPAATHTSGQDGGKPPEPSGFVIYRPVPVEAPAMCDFGPSVSSGGAAEAQAALLDRSGPQMPSFFSMSAFSVMGFVKGSWPVVFDYLLEQDSLLIVVVAPEGREPLIYRLDGKKGHWQSRLTIPAQVGENSLVAQYAIHALDETVGQIGASHLHVHGIAAGPKAVGSIGIDQVTFAPAAIHPALGEKAHYTFHSIRDFKHIDIDFVRIGVTKDRQIIAGRVDSKSMGGISRDEQKEGEWDGKDRVDSKSLQGYPPQLQEWLSAPKGQHLVQVRAWWGVKDGDWALALSEDSVTVE
jgi:hypothetical protein